MHQILLAALSLTAIACTQFDVELHKYAPLFGLMSQPFWLYSSYKSKLWGIFTTSVVFTFIWAYGFYTHWLI